MSNAVGVELLSQKKRFSLIERVETLNQCKIVSLCWLDSSFAYNYNPKVLLIFNVVQHCFNVVLFSIFLANGFYLVDFTHKPILPCFAKESLA